jgi:FixJ family two-component response regulator
MKNANTESPQIIIIDDDELFRRSLARLLESHGHSVARYESFDQLTEAARIPQIGCAILDLDLPGSNGLDIQAKLTAIAPALSVVFLTGFGKVTSSVRAMKAGAIDFLEKPIEESVVLQAVEDSVNRSKRLQSDRVSQEHLRSKFDGLTFRERQVFKLITSGLLNKQAAAHLGLREKTIKVYRARVMEKMVGCGVAGRTGQARASLGSR